MQNNATYPRIVKILLNFNADSSSDDDVKLFGQPWDALLHLTIVNIGGRDSVTLKARALFLLLLIKNHVH